MLRQVTELPLTNSIILRPFLGFYNESGYSCNHLLKRYGLTKAMITPECYIPSYNLCHIINSISCKTNQSNIGVRAATINGYPSIHPDIACNIPKADSFLDLFLFLSSKRKLQGSHFKIWITHSGDTFNIYHNGYIPYNSKTPEQTEYFRTLMLINVIKAFLGKEWRPDTISLESPLPPPHQMVGITRLQKIFVDQDNGCIPVKASLDNIAEKIVLNQIDNVDTSTSFQRLITATETFVEHQDLSLPFISDVFGCSKRSIQRILKEQGTSFQHILNQVRFDHTKKLLAKNMNINLIANKFGYKDPSNFSRAFKRYTGTSPSDFRNSIIDR